MKILPLLAILGMPLISPSGLGAVFQFSLVRYETLDLHQSFTVDADTGKYYQRPGIGFTGQDVLEFDNAAAFEAGVSSRTIPLIDGYYGTYVAAQNGMLFARSQLNPDFSGAGSSRFNLATGTIETTRAFPNVGMNGDDTFAWGGLTSMNFYSDPSGLFALGKTADPGGQTWQLSRLDSDLNTLDSRTFQVPEIGFAVMVDGKLFVGQHTFDINGNLVTDGFSGVLDYATGDYSAVDHVFTGLGDTQYIDDLVYDAATDTIYAHNRAGGQKQPAFYKMGNVSKVLSGDIIYPVPDSLNIMAALGLLSAGMLSISRPARFGKS